MHQVKLQQVPIIFGINNNYNFNIKKQKMKSIVICLTILAFAAACVLACDPDSNNQPECSNSNLNIPIRNFWDPTHYWLCKSPGAAAESVRCPDSQGFDSAKGQCVSFEIWQWAEPCPAAAA